MGSFIQNSRAYNIKAETEIAVILSHFDTNYVYGIMEDKLREVTIKFNPVSTPNLTNSFEDNFKAILLNYPESREEILQTREQSYFEIIAMISNKFNFQFTPTVDMDSYGVSNLLYDFFVSNYHVYLVKFVTKYIINECEVLYNALQMEQFKKDKDVTTLSNKKLYDNSHLAIICSHLNLVIDYMTELDFSMEQILNVIYNNNYTFTSVFLQHVFSRIPFYTMFYVNMVNNPEVKADLISAVRWEIQRTQSNIQLNF